MAATTEQKVDFLLKKIGYVASKTGIAEDENSLSGTKKAPFAEAIPSPLVTPSTSIWADASLIPATPPGSDTSYVKVYLTGTSGVRMTVDNTVSGNRTFIARSTYGNDSSAILGDWIDTSFGADYIIKVFKGDPNSGGVQLSAAGAGSNDTWFFDYSSGVLNFNGTQIPSGVTSSNIYIVGYRYIGAKGGRPAAGIATFSSLDVAGISTFRDDVNFISANGNNISFDKSQNALGFGDNVKARFGSDTDLEIYHNNSHGVIDNLKGNLFIKSFTDIVFQNRTGNEEMMALRRNGAVELYYDDVKRFETTSTGAQVTGNLNVTGVLTYDDVTNIDSLGIVTARTGVDVNAGGINVDGGGLNIVGVSTFASNIDANGDLDVDGHTNLDNLNVVGVATFTGSKFDIQSTGESFVKRTGSGGNSIVFIVSGDGNNQPLQEFRHGSARVGTISKIGNTGIRIKSDTLALRASSSDESYLEAVKDGAVELYYDDVKRFSTSGVGATVSGNLDITADLDVDGHTELDNVNISGLTTAALLNVSSLTDTRVTFASASGRLSDSANLTFDGTNLTAASAKISDLTSGRVVTAGTNGALQDSANLTFNGSLLDVTGNLAVSGNVSIAGTLTYQDVTNIDSVGIATARVGLKVLAGGIEIDGGGLDVQAGVSTFASNIIANGNIDLAGDIDVDGHTNLDNVSVSGIITANGFDYVSGDSVILGLGANGGNAGARNVIIGEGAAGDGSYLGINDVIIGYNAGSNLTTGGGVIIGKGAGAASTTASVTYVGNSAGQYQTLSWNTALGGEAMQGVSGSSNGSHNTALGTWTLRRNQSQENTAVGSRSMKALTSSSNQNTGVGAYTLHSITSNSSENTALGYRAGDALVTGSNNIIIGYNADASTTTTSNEITLGDANITHLRVPGIGVSFNSAAGTQLGIVTATELDISGASVFNDDVTFTTQNGNNIVVDKSDNSLKFGDNITAKFGDNSGNGDLWIYHDTGHSYVRRYGSGNLRLTASSGKIQFQKHGADTLADFNVDGSIDLYYDNTLRFQTSGIGVTVTGETKTTTLNVTGITTTNNLNVTGTATIASIGSTVGVSSNFYFGDDKRIYFGQGEDLSVYHDGTHSYINESGVGSLKILTTGLDVRNTADNQRMALFTANGSVSLYHNNFKKIETTIGGIDVTGTTDTDNFVNAGVSTFVGIITASAVGNVIPFLFNNYSDLPAASSYHGAFAHVHTVAKGFFAHAGNWVEIVSKEADGRVGSGTETYNIKDLNVVGVSTFAGDIYLGDNDTIRLGDGADLQIFHNGSKSVIQNDVGDLDIINKSGGWLYLRPTSNHKSLVAKPNAETILYHANSPKIQTTSTGIDVTGTTTTDGLVVSGVSTFAGGSFSGDISAVNGTFSGNVSIAGTLTYQDVTNIDSVGIVTARTDLHVGTGATVIKTVNGQVGINSTIPAHMLDVGGVINSSTDVRVNNESLVTQNQALNDAVAMAIALG